ncbi:hypothetical protein HDU76_000380 [Blyttiomyces sp. JEL0837]|nr:hypothetical protein HDU76_000380 [Blyttiomyces sp. JEL0837]
MATIYPLHDPHVADGTDTYSFFDTVTATWTYVVVDTQSKQTVIIDSVLDYDLVTGKITTASADKVLHLVKEKGLIVSRILETHCHADHLTAAQYLKKKLGGNVPVCIGEGIKQVQQVVKNKYSLHNFPVDGSQFDCLLKEGDKLPLGKQTIEVHHTPGHTPDSNTFQIGNSLYLGDLLFLPDVGTARCDFPGGSATSLHNSITSKILKLSPDAKLYAGHDYPPGGDSRTEPRHYATVEEQRKSNKHVKEGTTLEEFKKWREERDSTLGQPRLLHASLQCNGAAGLLPKDGFFKTPVTISGNADF